MTKTIYPASLLCDFYKVSHRDQYPKNTETIYSTFTPRSNKYFPQADEVVVFGIQYFVKNYLIDYFNTHFFNRPKEEVVAEYVRYIKFTLGTENPDASHIEKLHDLGYLPVKLSALKEGTLAPIKVPVLTIENTEPKFFWVTNYLETLMSAEIWLPMTSATIAHQYRKMLDKYAMKTVGNTLAVDFQGHDFSLRGMESLEAGAKSGAGHLLSFTGTDTIPAIAFHEAYYNANIENELVGASIPATEHATMSANTDADSRDEFEMYKRLITEVYPSGLFSVVSDTYDFWAVIGDILPRLKDEIMARDGKVVIRPDSGDPVKILVGNNIPDLTDPRYPDETPEDMRDYFADEIHNMDDLCGDGYMGEDSYTFKFKLNDKYYKITLDVEYNRHDKRYYYIDYINFNKVEEFTPKLEDLGLIEALWNIFGGTVSDQGYKVLDSHIGAIYGDSITLERARQICEGLEKKGFASINVVMGIGSYTYQYNTRDTLGFAMKATYAVVNGEERLLFKDPKTDDGTKRSQRGLVAVTEVAGEISYDDNLNRKTYDANFASRDLLEPVFIDGKLVRDESLKEIRDRLNK